MAAQAWPQPDQLQVTVFGAAAARHSKAKAVAASAEMVQPLPKFVPAGHELQQAAFSEFKAVVILTS